MIILSLDTSNKASSISVLDKKKLVGKIFLDCDLTHSKTISDMTKKFFDLMSFNVKSVDLFSVCTGPGSFTGIRIGLSFIKGISLVFQKPCIGVSSLLALSYSIENKHNDEVIYSCIYANKDEVYFNSFGAEKGSDDRFVTLEKLKKIAKEEERKIIFVGDAANLCYEICHNYCRFAPKFYVKQVDSEFVGRAAYDVFLSKNENLTLKANYIKKTRAENNFSLKN